MYYENPSPSPLPSRGKTPLYRNVGVGEYWSVAQPDRSIDPLTSIDLDLAPLAFRKSLPIKPFFELTGAIPDGMTIDAYTGEIHWTPSVQDADATYTILVKVENAADRSALQTQLNVVHVHVNAFSRPTAYVRDIFSDLLGRQPTPSELASWTGLLQSGTSRLAVRPGHRQDRWHYAIAATDVYLTVLSRKPTASELASALNLFHSGGNSDQLTKSLLTSPAFIKLHKGTRSYVDAVNMILTFKTASKAVMAREVAWLKAGRSRSKLVARSSGATPRRRRGRAGLSGRYVGGTASSKTVAQWAAWLASGEQNTDSLTILILASDDYVNGVDSRAVPAPQAANGGQQPPVQSHQSLAVDHDGRQRPSIAARRPRIAALSGSILEDRGGRRLRRPGGLRGPGPGPVPGPPPQVGDRGRDFEPGDQPARRQSGRDAPGPAPGERRVPRSVRVDGGLRERGLRVLTGGPASASTLRSWTLALQAGRPAIEMTQAAASSKSGKVGQIDRLYAEVMLRDPSTAEIDQWLCAYQGSSPRIGRSPSPS